MEADLATIGERLAEAIASSKWGSVHGFQKALKADERYGGKGQSRKMIQQYTSKTDPVTPPIEFLNAAARLLGVREAWLVLGQGERTEEEEGRAAQREEEARDAMQDLLGGSAADAAALEEFLVRGSDAGSRWRRAAVLRLMRRLEDAGVVGPDRTGVITAAVRFLEGAERAYAGCGQRMDYDTAERGWHPALQEPNRHTAAGYVAWSDAVLEALAQRIRGYGAPAEAGPTERAIEAAEVNTQQEEASNGGEAEA